MILQPYIQFPALYDRLLRLQDHLTVYKASERANMALRKRITKLCKSQPIDLGYAISDTEKAVMERLENKPR